MPSHYFLAFMVSTEKLVLNITEDPLCNMSHFSLAAFKLLPLSMTFDSLIMLCLGIDIFELTLFGICEAS